MRQMERGFDVTVKSSHDDVVTTVDTMVQSFFVDEIRLRYPNDNFLAEEEYLQDHITLGNVWVIDPIDGTLNFVTQQSDFTIMLSYFENGVGQFGLIYDVMADQLYAGGPQFPPVCNQTPLPEFNGRTLQQSLVACNTGMLLQNDHGIADLIKSAIGVRNYGCAGLSFMKVLNNQMWAYFSCIYPWDYAAASIIGQTLGYTLLTLDGEQPDYSSRQMVMFVPNHYKDDIVAKLNN